MHWGNASDLTWWQWVLLGVVMLTQSLYMFQDAQKRGAKAWLWGLYGLTSAPTAYIVYWLCVVRKRKSN